MSLVLVYGILLAALTYGMFAMAAVLSHRNSILLRNHPTICPTRTEEWHTCLGAHWDETSESDRE